MDVGAPEGVDGLLGIADDEERILAIGVEKHFAEDPPLGGVGVLELVDEGVVVTGSKRLDELVPSGAVQAIGDDMDHVVEIVEAFFALEGDEALPDGR